MPSYLIELAPDRMDGLLKAIEYHKNTYSLAQMDGHALYTQKLKAISVTQRNAHISINYNIVQMCTQIDTNL